LKKKLFLLLLALSYTGLYAQREAAIWYFGNKAGLDFNSGSPVALTNGELITTEGCASFSDKDGRLLFYTDGTYVWNRNHQIMPMVPVYWVIHPAHNLPSSSQTLQIQVFIIFLP
jgi:hypothetical protein